MTLLTPMRSTACVIALLSASAASADVTAADVWADWQESLSLYGEDGVSIGGETMDGDTLTISDITLTMSDETATVTASLGDLVLVEQGDGTVSVEMPANYPITIENKDGNVVKMSMNQTGLILIVSGTPAEMNYAMSAAKYGLTVDQLLEDGKPMKADIRVTANDLQGNYTTKTDALRAIDYSVNVGSLDMLVDVTPPSDAGDYFTLSGKLEGLSTQAAMVMPLAENIKDPEDIFAGGFSLDGGYAFSGGNYIFDMQAEGAQTSGSIATGAGTLSATMDETAISYNSETNDLAVAVNGGAVPFPIEVSLAQYGVGFDMPLGKTDGPADFGMRLNLTDLSVNDMIWMLADPSGALPHDPATLLLDLSGKAKLFYDLLDPEQADAIAEAKIPGELNEVTLNNMRLSVAGAEVTGLGGFTFDNSDLETFDGMPRPTGDVTVNIKGANVLIDKLVQMGLLPEEQAMMGRMMMGMFARTTGDDELTSKIEINKEGHVIANGQRIQ